jgi:hypothetical protein
MNLNNLITQNRVIPAQAGIQIIKKSPAKRGNIAVLSPLLDSRLRGNDGLMDYLR